jgi:hypothetical protein
MRHHRANLNIRLELEHTEAIKRAVESGLGIGCISRLALRDAFRRGSLVPVETPDLDLARQFYFIWHKQKYQTSAMREFLELCRSFTAGCSAATKSCCRRSLKAAGSRPTPAPPWSSPPIARRCPCPWRFSTGVALQRNAVDGRFHRRVEQLDDQPQQAHRNQDRPLDTADRQPESVGISSTLSNTSWRKAASPLKAARRPSSE